MSHRIYTPEFKDEAVRQVVERGYTVKKVAARLGISEASLYGSESLSAALLDHFEYKLEHLLEVGGSKLDVVLYRGASALFGLPVGPEGPGDSEPFDYA